MDKSIETEFGDHGFSIVEYPDEKISEEPISTLPLTYSVKHYYPATYYCNAPVENGRCQAEVAQKGDLCYYHQKQAQGLIE